MRIINGHLERQRGDRANARNGHEATADRIGRYDIQHHRVQSIVPFDHPASHLQHAVNHPLECPVGAFEKLADTGFELAARDRPHPQTVNPQRAPDMVF
jgi:hypothetical protein